MKFSSSSSSLSSLKNIVGGIMGATREENGGLLPGFDAASSYQQQRQVSQMKRIIIVLSAVLAILFIYNVHSAISAGANSASIMGDVSHASPLFIEDNSRTDYPIILCADRDSYSFNKESNAWTSVLIEGTLKRDPDAGTYSAQFPKDEKGKIITTPLVGKLAEGKRGLELSELKRFNGHLYTFDDRTGIVYEILDKDPESGKRKVVARYILNDGDGHTDKGFKSEWATVKDNKLYVGSIGKEWTTGSGEIISKNPMYVKTIDLNGGIRSLNWEKQYSALREAVDVPFPGYMIHESVEWSDFYKRWFFLPRRVSKLPYDEEKDVNRGSNIMIAASEDFKSISVKRIGDVTPTRGFSTFKFIPGRPREIVAVKTEEVGEKMSSYITVFNTSGKVLLPETLIAEEKIEGIEIE